MGFENGASKQRHVVPCGMPKNWEPYEDTHDFLNHLKYVFSYRNIIFKKKVKNFHVVDSEHAWLHKISHFWVPREDTTHVDGCACTSCLFLFYLDIFLNFRPCDTKKTAVPAKQSRSLFWSGTYAEQIPTHYYQGTAELSRVKIFTFLPRSLIFRHIASSFWVWQWWVFRGGTFNIEGYSRFKDYPPSWS